MKQNLITLAIMFFALVVNAQSKTEIINKGIEVKRTYDQDIENGDKERSLNKEEFFDAKGQLIEVKEYSDKGQKIKNWEKFKYNIDGDVIEEQELDSKGVLTKKTEYKYENGLKTERLEYDGKGRLTERRSYEYSFRK
jgi:hypothetical protein